MDGSTIAIIVLAGGFLTIGCAAAFVWFTADELPDDGELGGEAFIVSPHRATDHLARELDGLVAGDGGEPVFQLGDDAFVFEGEEAAPVVRRNRGRVRLVK